MADKSFGVKELNLLNASGTPTVTSPNNLNLNANTVAISTSCTIGSNLTVTSTTNSANLNITGIGTLTRAFATDLSVSGVTTITVPANANPHSSWDVVNNSASAYRFTGPGQDGTEDNPDIYLVRGQRYVFKMNASGHPFQIRVSNGGSAYSDGVTNNGSQTGNVVFNVQHDAPAHLFYQCTSHGSMVGNIYIVGQHLANGADNRVLTATSAYGMTGESGLTFSSDRLILTNTSTPQIRINNDTSDGSGTRFVFGKATANNNFFNGAVAGDSCIGFPSTLLFGIGATEKLRIDSSGNFNLGLTASPVSSSTSQGVYLAGANSTQSVISSDVTPFVVNRVGTGGNDRNCIEFRNNGSMKGTVGAVGVNNGIFFQSGVTEVMRITNDYKVLVGLTTTTTTTSNNNFELASTKMLKVGNMYIGYVIGTGNNGNGTLVLHKLGQNIGMQFAGFVTVHSYTGSAYLSGCITARYNNDAVSRDISLQKANDGMNFQLVTGTISGQSGSYLGIKKNGGGTGSFYINAFLGGNIETYGGLREISSSNWTTTTVHGSGITGGNDPASS